MKAILFCIMLATGFGPSLLAGTTYAWKTAADGSWSEPANWGSVSACPGDDVTDKVDGNVAGTYTMTLDADVMVAMLKDMNNGIKTIDLGGKVLTVTGAGSNGLYLNHGYGPSSFGDMSYSSAAIFKNGTLTVGAVQLGYGNLNGRAVLDLSDVTFNSRISSWNLARVIVRDGSVWNPTGDTTIEAGTAAAYFKYPFLCVTGETSRVEAMSRDLTVGSEEGALFVRDGARATYRNVNVGTTAKSINCAVVIDDATLAVSNVLSLGTSEQVAAKGSRLVVAGPHGYVRAEGLALYENTGASVELTVPTAGFTDASGIARAPISAGVLSAVIRDEAAEDFGATQLKLTCATWANANPGAVVSLIRLDEPAADILQVLKSNVRWTDYSPEAIAAGLVPALAVSADGCGLVMTAPTPYYKPTFTVSTAVGQTTGAKTVKVLLQGYGYGSDSVTAVECTYADNADLVGAMTTNFLAGLAPVEGELPLGLDYQLQGAFAQHVRYWARVRVTNANSLFDDVLVEFRGDGQSETLKWGVAENGNWQDSSRWLLSSGAAASTWPGAEDAVDGNVAGNFTIRLQEDAAVSKWKDDKEGLRVLDLNGYALAVSGEGANGFYINQGASPSGPLDRAYSSATVVRDGTLTIGAIQLGFGNTSAKAMLDLSNVALTTRVSSWNNARMVLRDGSIWTVTRETMLESGVTGKDFSYPYLCVTGAASRVVADARDLTVGSVEGGLYLQDGAEASYKNVLVGTTAKSLGCLVSVEDSLLRVGTELRLGSADQLAAKGSRLVLAGRRARVEAATLTVCGKAGTSIEVTVPAGGFSDVDGAARAAIAADGLSFPSRDASDAETQLKIAMKDWMKAHPGESVDLIELKTADPSALETLKSLAVFSDVDPARYPGHAFLTVSADGTRLVLNAPALRGLMILFR